ncbi:MAG: polyphosphate:AMP phosphotransferase [Calditerrivibrio sp.]|nr:polyphosphate:AMP phosphotransferase [Calditerrivibrio sp.]
MFELVEMGKKISKDEYEKKISELRQRLFFAQLEAKKFKIPVVVLIAGIDGAGRGEIINLITEFMDTRYIKTHTFWAETEEERERPPFWRYWRSLASAGTTSLLFGGWYENTFLDLAYRRIDIDRFDRRMQRRVRFERTLYNNGTYIVKFWLHLSEDGQKRKVKKIFKEYDEDVAKFRINKNNVKHYKEIVAAAARSIRVTDRVEAPWVLIDSYDWRNRNVNVIETLVNLYEGAVKRQKDSNVQEKCFVNNVNISYDYPSILDNVDLSVSIGKKDYEEKLEKLQLKLWSLTWKAHQKKVSTIVLFEGWDAAGKGGCIRRITKGIDSRLYQVIQVAAPTDEEKAHHYLWRFWRHVPRFGFVTIYDRSWYGRVLVERVENFATPEEWGRSYSEINDFEEQLTQYGKIILFKFWLHISMDEQLKRFEERQSNPLKQYKITDEDWRNREKWDIYKNAVDDMVAKTSTDIAPWHIIPANDKKYARIEVLERICDSLEKHLKNFE